MELKEYTRKLRIKASELGFELNRDYNNFTKSPELLSLIKTKEPDFAMEAPSEVSVVENQPQPTVTPPMPLPSESDKTISVPPPTQSIMDNDLLMQLIQQNKDMAKKIEDLEKKNEVEPTMAERVDVHTVGIAMLNNKYVIKAEKVLPIDLNKRWEDDGMKLKVTLLDPADGTSVEEVEITQLNLLRTVRALRCPMLSKRNITIKRDFGDIDESMRTSDGEIKLTGRKIRNIVIENIDTEFEVMLPKDLKIKVLSNVINLTNK